MSLPITYARAASVAALLSIAPLSALAQTNLTLSEARRIAPLALENGDLNLASTLSNGLLLNNADDMTGLIVQASVLQRTGDHQGAIKLAKRAARLADTRNEKFVTATLLAQSYLDIKAYERSKFWLRIASQNADSPIQKRNIAQSYKLVRRESPWSTSFQFNISPSDNVNNGSDETEIYGCFFGLFCGTQQLDNAEPLSGIIFQLSGTANYTLSESQTVRTTAGVDVSHQHVELVGNDRKTSPYKGSDFNYTYLGGHLSETRLVGTKGITLSSRLSFGRSWIKRPSISGDVVTERPISATDSTSFSMNASKVLTPTRRATLGYGLNMTEDRDNNIRSSQSLSVRFSDEHILRNNDRLTWAISGKRTNSASLSTANQSSDLTLSYAPAKRISGVSATFSASVGWRQDKNVNSFTQTRRKDHSLNLRGTFTANNVSFYGFSPVAIVEASKTNSNNPLYKSKALKMRMNFVTSF